MSRKEYNGKITCVGLLHRVLLLPLLLRLLFLDGSFLLLILQLLSSENSNVQEVSTEELVPAYSSSRQRQFFNSCPLQPLVVASSSTRDGICKNITAQGDTLVGGGDCSNKHFNRSVSFQNNHFPILIDNLYRLVKVL